MATWISRERTNAKGKVQRDRVDAGMAGVKPGDRFIVYWMDPDQRQRQKRIPTTGKPGKRLADDFAEKTDAELTLGSYQGKKTTTWADFRKEFEKQWVSEKSPNTRLQYTETFGLFEAICSPKLMRSITTATVDQFRTGLRQRRGRKKESTLSPATVNKHLRHLRTALRRAYKRDYLAKVPEIAMMREPEKMPVYMLPEHFDAIYKACCVAKHPAGRPYSAAAWWKALLTLGIMSGMRIEEMVLLPWYDVYLDEGYLIVRHNRSNKAKRDDRVPLHPVVVEHLRAIQDIGREAFDWPMETAALYREFHRIQVEAGIHLDCHEEHEHTDACHVYGFHALKKACGTLNAGRMSRAALGSFMRHRSSSTTDKHYINRDRLAADQTDVMFVPSVLER